MKNIETPAPVIGLLMNEQLLVDSLYHMAAAAVLAFIAYKCYSYFERLSELEPGLDPIENTFRLLLTKFALVGVGGPAALFFIVGAGGLIDAWPWF